jgi:hypothetical protein
MPSLFQRWSLLRFAPCHASSSLSTGSRSFENNGTSHKENNPSRAVLGNNRRQSEQSRLKLAAASQRLIPTGERSGLLTHIAQRKAINEGKFDFLLLDEASGQSLS